ncbi:MAG: hypothetical protein ABEN55_22655, partial [Bradymonadaceae bacterium]
TLRKDGYSDRTEVVRVRAGSRNNFQWNLDQSERVDESENVGDSEASDQSETADRSQTLPWIAAIVGGAGALTGATLYGIGQYCGGNRPSCRLGLYKTAAVGPYIAGGIGLVGLGTAGAIWLPRMGRDGGAGERAGVQLELRFTGGGLAIGGQF